MPFLSMICSNFAAAPPGCLPDAGDSHFCTVEVVTLRKPAKTDWLIFAFFTRMRATCSGV